MIMTTTTWDASPLRTVLQLSVVESKSRFSRLRTLKVLVRCQKMKNHAELSLLASSILTSVSPSKLVVYVDIGLTLTLKVQSLMSRLEKCIPTALRNVFQLVTLMNSHVQAQSKI